MRDAQNRRPTKAGPPVRVVDTDGAVRWYVSRFADVQTVLSCPHASSDPSRSGFPEPEDLSERTPFLIELDAPRHTQLRRLVLPEFTTKAVEALEPQLQDGADRLLADFTTDRAKADLDEAFAKPLSSLAICLLLGVPASDGPFLTRVAGVLGDDTHAPEAQGAAFAEVTAYMESLVTERIAKPTPDLFGRLASEALPGEQISQEEMVSLAIMLLMAGHDTNAKMIVLGVGTLLGHPDAVARIVADEVTANAAVDELVRLHSVGDDDGFRVATAPILLDGQSIAAGDGIVPLVRLANHDTAMFDHADRFDLDRDGKRHLGFGYGPHLCLGRTLARAVQAIAYRTLFGKIPTLQRWDGSDRGNGSLMVTGWRQDRIIDP